MLEYEQSSKLALQLTSFTTIIDASQEEKFEEVRKANKAFLSAPGGFPAIFGKQDKFYSGLEKYRYAKCAFESGRVYVRYLRYAEWYLTIRRMCGVPESCSVIRTCAIFHTHI